MRKGPLLRWDDWWIAGGSSHRRRGRSKREVTEQEDEEEEEDEDNVARDAVSKVRVATAMRRRGSGGVSGRNGAVFWPRGRTTLDVVASGFKRIVVPENPSPRPDIQKRHN